MELDAAIRRIQKSFQKMNATYGRAVFDEIAVVGLEGARLKLYYYEGPRESRFMDSFADDSTALRRELTADQSGLGGEFGFIREGRGAEIDAYICLGPDIYLFCNNTQRTVHEITADPLWLNAQNEFLNGSQYFARDPLSVN